MDLESQVSRFLSQPYKVEKSSKLCEPQFLVIETETYVKVATSIGPLSHWVPFGFGQWEPQLLRRSEKVVSLCMRLWRVLPGTALLWVPALQHSLSFQVLETSPSPVPLALRIATALLC